MDFPSFLSRPPKRTVREEYRGRGTSHSNSYAPKVEPLPDPQTTIEEWETGARSVEQSGARQLAFAMQVDAYCKEIAQQMRVRGQTAAAEIRRAVAMSQKVAAGAQSMAKFIYDEGLSAEREELAEAPRPVDGGKLPADEPAEPTSSEGEKGAPEGAKS